MKIIFYIFSGCYQKSISVWAKKKEKRDPFKHKDSILIFGVSMFEKGANTPVQSPTLLDLILYYWIVSDNRKEKGLISQAFWTVSDGTGFGYGMQSIKLIF